MDSMVSDVNFEMSATEAAALRSHVSQFSEMLVRDFLSKQGFEGALGAMNDEAREQGRPPPTLESFTTMAGLLGLTPRRRPPPLVGSRRVS